MKRLLSIILPIIFVCVGIGLSLVPESLFHEEVSIVSILLLALPAYIGLIKICGTKTGILLIAILGLFSLAIETIGVMTGFPYGSFSYTRPVGYMLFGTTPWTVFFAWSPLVIGSSYIAYRTQKSFIRQLITSIVLLLALDLVLDPGSVARGLWTYTHGGIWYGVPLQNFFGWILSGGLATSLLLYIYSKKKRLDSDMTQASFVTSASLWTGVTLGYTLFIPALIGCMLLITLSLLPTQKNQEVRT